MMFVLLQLSLLFLKVLCDERTVVETPSGPIMGISKIVQFTEDIAYSFYKIPYAKPPIGSRRFCKPEPLEPWNEVFDATDDFSRPLCLQKLPPSFANALHPDVKFGEDCLFLSVFVPKDIIPNDKLAVMAWIHGGSFAVGGMYGFGSDGSDIAVRAKVIVVTIQYRLNVFGFLSTNSDALRGNYGLWDQIMAFTWIQKNIASFGGDPSRVTIFGLSAGGMSVHIHSLIPTNQGLFKRVIAQSGTSSFWAVKRGLSENILQHVMNNTKCELKGNHADFANCLRKIPANMLSEQASIFMAMDGNATIAMPYPPVVDGELFNDLPHLLMKDKSSNAYKFYKSIDLMTGLTNFEGNFQYYSLTRDVQENIGFKIEDGINEDILCNRIAPSYSKNHFDENPDISRAICKYYTLTEHNEQEQSLHALEIWADSVMKAPAIDALNAHTQDKNRGSSYLYMFSRPHVSLLMPPFPPKWFKPGCGHADDAVMLFKEFKGNERIIKDDDIQFSNLINRYWTNFAKTGNPNSERTPVVWPQYTPTSKKYIDLDTTVTVKTDMSPEAVNFWLNEIPALQKHTKDEL